MTDDPNSLPNEESEKLSPEELSADVTDLVESTDEKEVPPGMLPLVPPVFGKYAFWITAVPFLIYLIGTGMGSYFENVRKTGPVHKMRGICRAMSDNLRESVTDGLGEEEAKRILDSIDIDGVETALDDEASDVAKLLKDCDSLRTVNVESLHEDAQPAIVTFQKYVNHFLELDRMEEQDETDDILQTHSDFLKSLDPDGDTPGLTESWYPRLYSIACILAFLAIIVALPGYLKHPFRISPFAIGVGVAGIFVWLGLWWLDKEVLHIGEMLSPGKRAAFNPFLELAATPTWMYTFLGIRLLGLCLVIPIAEEFFARGFLMRYIEDIDWDQIPLGEATWKGLAGIIAYGAMTHPGEIVAAVAWFGLVTWMYLKTKNIWDCVVAHSVTNGLLGAFVLITGTWELW